MNAYRLLLLVLGFFWVTTTTGQGEVSLTTNATFEGILCPGYAIFTCNGTELSRLIWYMNGIEDEDKVVNFDPDSTPSTIMLSPSVTVELINVVQDPLNPSNGNFLSILRADLFALNENMTRNVSCGDLDTIDTSQIPVFSILSPVPKPVYTCDIRTTPTSVVITLDWIASFTMNSTVETYCVRASGGSCPSEQCLTPNTSYTCSGLIAGQEHNFTVTGVNCGSQEGPADSFTITPQVPESTAMCSSVPIYMLSSGKLSRIEIAWNASTSLPELKAGISQNVTSYFITHTGNEGVSKLVDEACTDMGQCSYAIDDFRNLAGPYTITVSAEYIVARSDPRVCIPQQIYSENNIVEVSLTTDTTADTQRVHCEFLQNILSSAGCEVCYGTQSPCVITGCVESQVETGRRTDVTFPANSTCLIITATIDGELVVLEGSTVLNAGLLPWHQVLIALAAACVIGISTSVIYCRGKLQCRHGRGDYNVAGNGEDCKESHAAKESQTANKAQFSGSDIKDHEMTELGTRSKTSEPNRLNKDELKLQLDGVTVISKPDVCFDDIAGLETAKEVLRETVIQPAHCHSAQFKDERKPSKAILLYGPPGTGKLYLAKAVANEANLTFFSVSSSHIVKQWGAESKKKIKLLIEKARERQPAVIFIDDVDQLCASGSGSSREDTRRYITEFLWPRDEGTDNQNEGVVILGATDFPWTLDEGIRKIFKKRIYIGLPEADARKKIIQLHLQLELSLRKTQNTLSDGDFTELVDRTKGYTGDDIKALVNEASMTSTAELETVNLSEQQATHTVTFQDFREALKRKRSVFSLDKYAEFTRTYGQSDC